MGILIREHGGDWLEPIMGYDSEKTLQEIIHAHPSLVSGKGPDGVEKAVACRELQSGVGPADVVVIDADGTLTLVECKLASNREVRREIIGQVLDYASRIWRMSVDEFERAWVNTGEPSPFSTLGDDDGSIRAAVQDNLESARFKIVLAVDGINDDIRRIVEFLNRVTVAETGVVVVEFARASVGNIEVLIPTSFGTDFVEIKSDQVSNRRLTVWTPDTLLAEVEARYSGGTVASCKAFLDAASQCGLPLGPRKAVLPGCSITIAGTGTVWLKCYSERLGLELDFRYTKELSGAARERYEAFLEEISALDPELWKKVKDPAGNIIHPRQDGTDLGVLPSESVKRLVHLIAEFSRPS